MVANIIAACTAAAAIFALWYYSRQANAAEAQSRALIQQLAKTELARKNSLQPHVVVEIRPRGPATPMLALFISNVGATSARDVRIEVDKQLRSSLGEKVEGTLNAVVSRPISSLAPGQSLMWNMDIGFRLAEAKNLPRTYTFTVRADGPFGPIEPTEQLVDLSLLLTTSLNADAPEAVWAKLAENAGRLAEAMDEAAGALQRQAERR